MPHLAWNNHGVAFHPFAGGLLAMIVSTAFRAALRQEKLSARMSMPAEEHLAASGRIRAALAGFLAGRPPTTLGVCVPVRGEPDCLPLATELAAAGWSIVMPVVEAPAAPLRFRAWHAGAPMTQDPHGIPVPATAACAPPEILLLPLVAFDPAGYRLGYGGGYFDRTLAACVPRPFTIGVGFDLCRVDTIRPAPHDIPLDRIVTESGLDMPR